MIRHAKSIPLLLAFAIGIILFSCKDDGGPPPPNGPDTTSHNFIFSLDTLGDGNSSVLNDVAIISENNVWVVGELYYRDSVGGFSQPMFNAARWNGTVWELKRIQVRDFGGVVGIFPLKAVFGFSGNDIWFASDADLIQWDGTAYRPRAFFMTSLSFDGQVKCMWGTSNNNLYCAGRTGSIYHFTGSGWQKLTSGTTVDIQDIWGATNAQNGQTEILAVASFRSGFPQAKKLLRITGTIVSATSDSGLPIALSGVWFKPDKRYHVVGDGLYSSTRLGEPWQYEPSLPLDYYKDAIRGIASNDVIISGSSGALWHYNGASWRAYRQIEAPAFYGRYYRVDFKGDYVVAVGWMNNTAVAIRGRRTN